MNFTICTQIRAWGNVNATELGRFRAMKIDESITAFCFTYPEVRHFHSLYSFVCQVLHKREIFLLQTPNEYPIVGIKMIDDNPPIIVDFVQGNIGDKQIVIQISVDGS